MDDTKQTLQQIILQAVCDVFAFHVFALKSRSRKREIADARHIASNCMQEYGFHPTEAATALHRSRVTMLNSRTRYAELYETDADFRRKADAVKKKVAEDWERAQKPVFTAQRVTASIIEPTTGKLYELGELKNVQTSPAQTYTSPEAMMRELERCKQAHAMRQAQALQRKAEHDKRLLRETLSEDAAFMLLYVPFVIIEVVWDYIDTILYIAKILRIQHTKKTTRTITELHREYDRKRFEIINNDFRKDEIKNMLVFEKELSDYFDKTFKAYTQALIETHGKVDENTTDLVTSVYVCKTILKALYRFTEAQERIVASIIGYHITSIVPDEMRKVDALVIEYAGDMKLPKQYDNKINELAEELAKFIGDIELNKTENE